MLRAVSTALFSRGGQGCSLQLGGARADPVRLLAAIPSARQVIKSPAAGPGMAAGLVWNLGNLACIMAVTDKRVGLAIAMPIMQVCAAYLVVNASPHSECECWSGQAERARNHAALAMCIRASASKSKSLNKTPPKPCVQCGLFVAGIWGITVFQEIRGAQTLALYWLSGGVLVAGAALLANAKDD